MEKWHDLYSILQIRHDAEQAVVEGAYKNLCKKYHPDVNPSPLAVTKMQRINHAYSILKDSESRKKYNEEWLTRFSNHSQTYADQTRTKTKDKWVHRDAYDVVFQYFDSIASSKFEQAYSLITDTDKQRISLTTFLDWQKSVSSSYKLTSFDVETYKHSNNYIIENVGSYIAEEFTILVSEMNNQTGIVSTYTFVKLALCESSMWRVYLGYVDLNNIINKYKNSGGKQEALMQEHWENYKKVTDIITRLPNLTGFYNNMEALVYGYKRYNRVFCVAAIKLYLPKKIIESDCYESVLRHIAEHLTKSLRIVDTVSYTDENTFVIVLAEIGIAYTQDVIKRIVGALKMEISRCFDFKVKLSIGVMEYRGEEAKKFYKSLVKLTENPEYLNIRLGNMIVKIKDINKNN